MGGGDVVVPFCESVDAYVKKGTGIDIALKAMLGMSRLVSIHGSCEETRENYAQFARAVVNCRMLINHFRYLTSFMNAVDVYKKREGPVLPWLLLIGSFFFRSLEQVFGDLNYYQMVCMHHWNRTRLSLGYWFFKSLSLTCGFLHELLRMKSALTSPQWKKRTPKERSEFLKAEIISLTRYICDMIVYYQWVPWYNPNKTLQYFCGALCGSLGSYTFWKETQAARLAAAKKASQPNGVLNGNKTE
ncbi:uncharacterized protein TM35_000341890 [Trypanosoma theileri]|uniref:Glycosomal membrane protein n=1 Tax=Trypanosoma theileri TaxID=67003 RepID=A0A1X0NLN6_9TRYP|nr:uncharacterized protein TM35_000341890 [Trypanosoma theileri]ORC85577.1 hypothetical protein TM35_000341890 [Trypanosoma theileri]